MTESGKPFDLQNELRIGGRATALSIMLKALANGDAKNAALLGEKMLKRVEHQAAVSRMSRGLARWHVRHSAGPEGGHIPS